MPETHRLEPGKPIQLATLPTRGREFHDDRAAAEAEFRSLRDELIEWQAKLYADGKRRLLIVLQAMDAGGKDGTIRAVFRGVNPQGVRVTSFKVPSKLELAHDFLWRIHTAVPPNGMIGVFNRSHYEDVLVVRVHHLVPEDVWRPRFDLINEFERMLAETGATILKFYLHISKEEQKKRFQARLDDPNKHWKFALEDVAKRKLWGDYMAAFEELLNRCSTGWAPWYVVPADQKWYRNLSIARTIVQALRRLDPRYPAAVDDLSGVVIE
jgi:PPK2 family polyphosphate:nucleotide phosphotransferase